LPDINRFQYESSDGVFASSSFALPINSKSINVLFFVSNLKFHDVYLIESNIDYLKESDNQKALATKIYNTTCSSYAAHRNAGQKVLPASVFYTTDAVENHMTGFAVAAQNILSIENPNDRLSTYISFQGEMLLIPPTAEEILDCTPSFSLVSDNTANGPMILDSVEGFIQRPVPLESSFNEFHNATAYMLDLALNLQSRVF